MVKKKEEQDETLDLSELPVIKSDESFSNQLVAEKKTKKTKVTPMANSEERNQFFVPPNTQELSHGTVRKDN